MDANVPELIPFAVHPHLGFWILAAVFKILPQQDWVARTVGHFFYVSFLTGFFLYVRHKSIRKWPPSGAAALELVSVLEYFLECLSRSRERCFSEVPPSLFSIWHSIQSLRGGASYWWRPRASRSHFAPCTRG